MCIRDRSYGCWQSGGQGCYDRTVLPHGRDPVSDGTSAGDLSGSAYQRLLSGSHVSDRAGFRREGEWARLLQMSDGGRYVSSENGKRTGVDAGIFYRAVPGLSDSQFIKKA